MCRVHFDLDTNKVSLLRLDKKRVEPIPTIVYDNPNDLPIEIKEKMALLDVMGKQGRAIDDVGYKVAPYTYWVLI